MQNWRRAASAARFLKRSKMFFEVTDKGIVVRVRLTPNASVATVKGLFFDEKGAAYIKIFVLSPPEKGKANKELIQFFSKKLKVAKSEIELVSGEISHYKKLIIKSNNQNVINELMKWNEENDGRNN